MADPQKYYKGRKGLKAAGVTLQFSKEQVEEYIKCKDDPIYFIKTYCKIVHVDRGVIPFELYDYQEEFINAMWKNSKTVLCTARQVGKTIVTASFFLWFVIFHPSKDVAILANKGNTAKEIMDKVQKIYALIPYWLQPGLVEWNKSSMVLENKSRILCETTSANSIRGYSISYILLDEFAFVDSNKATEFFTSVYPTLSSGVTTKIVIASTPNGLNHFYKLYMDAMEGRNGFTAVMVTWQRVPGRDQAWADDMRKVLGDAKFMQEMEADFQGSSNTLISSYYIKKMVYLNKVHSSDGFDILIKPEPEHIYFITVDTSEGGGQDYSAFTVIDATTMPYQLVAKYRSDHIQPILYPSIIYKVATDYNMAMVLVESNSIGSQVVAILHDDLEYENVIFSDKDTITQWGNSGSPGVKTTVKTKRIGCAALKTLIEGDQLFVNDFDAVVEISTFIHLRNSFAADSDCHDDLVMCLVMFAWLTTQQWFRDYTDIDIRRLMFAAEERRLNDELVPFGVINNGMVQDHTEEVVLDATDIWVDAQYNYSAYIRETYGAY
jgi:hypothetical protein